MNNLSKLVIFTLDEQRYVLHLSNVEKIFRAAEITALPKAPPIIMGLINIQGTPLPVINVRKRFNLPARELELDDRLILAHTNKRKVVIVVDTVEDVIESQENNTIAAENILPNIDYVEGILKIDDSLILIHDLDKFLLLEEEDALNAAMEKSNF